MTTKPTERDLVEEVEELLAKAPKHNEPNHVSNGWVIGYYEGVEFRKVAKFYRKPALNFFEAAPELLRHMVEEVKRLRLKVDAITGSRIRDLVEDDHDD